MITYSEQTKPLYMLYLKLKQLQFENESWKRLIGFMMEENIHLKNRLSEVLKESFDRKLLEEIETFQNEFIKEDELIGLLRHDVVELDKLLVREAFENDHIKRKVDNKVTNLRSNITHTEKQFGKLKEAFNNYLSDNIQ